MSDLRLTRVFRLGLIAWLGASAVGAIVACGADEADPSGNAPDSGTTDADTEDASGSADSGPTSFSISGTVTGFRGHGLVLSNGSEKLAVGPAALVDGDAGAGADAGAFDIEAGVPDGGAPQTLGFAFATKAAAYDVKVDTQPTDLAQTCTVTNGSGTATADVTNVAVSCVTNAFAIGGTVSGLRPDRTLVLQNGAGEELTFSTASAGHPSFAFATKVEDGQLYDVTVKTQPAQQTCTVSKGAGIVDGAAITNVEVVCACNVLVLGASSSSSDNAFVAALDAVGFKTSLVPSAAGYTGSPAASDFAAVAVLVGDEYSSDMPASGQQALVDANASATARTGLVHSEWGANHVFDGRWQTLKSTLLFSRASGTMAQLSFIVDAAQASHPIWSGLPSTFTTANVMGSNVGSTLINGGTTLASCAECGGIGVAIKDPATGRIVQNASAPDYEDSGIEMFLHDTNMTKLYVNSVKWASRCE